MDELTGAHIPAELHYLWQIYMRLRRRQGSNALGASPVSWSSIDAFVRNARRPLAPWEIEIIETLDDLYLSVQAKAARRKTET